MSRPRRDGKPPAEPNKVKLSELFLQKVKPRDRPFTVWDTFARGLAVVVHPSGSKAWKAVYSRGGRPRWFHIGTVGAIPLSDARKLASRVMFAVAEGRDPAADRTAERGRGTFEEMAARYVEEHAQKKNKSWKQADALVCKYVLPRWAKLKAADISRSDVKAMVGKIAAPISANQTLAAASAIFSWAIKQDLLKDNPCRSVDRNETRARERVLSDTEVPKFWEAFDDAGLLISSALKVLLLTGQRPGEITHMRWEHIEDGWWTLPGEPVDGWPGTKNGETHRVWIPAPAQAIIEELGDDGIITSASNDLLSDDPILTPSTRMPIDQPTIALETPGKTRKPNLENKKIITPLGFVFANSRGNAVQGLAGAMRSICSKIGADRATPHDLRRTFSTTVAALGFGRDAMNRVTNHREGGIASVYDRHGYADENKRVMEATAARLLSFVEAGISNVVVGNFPR